MVNQRQFAQEWEFEEIHEHSLARIFLAPLIDLCLSSWLCWLQFSGFQPSRLHPRSIDANVLLLARRSNSADAIFPLPQRSIRHRVLIHYSYSMMQVSLLKYPLRVGY